MPTTVRNNGTRQDTFITRVSLDGTPMGVWDKTSGGELDSDVIVYQPGGMVMPISLGGKKTTGDMTLTRNYDRVDDHDKINTWLNAVGRGKVTVSTRPMDQNGNEYGKSIIRNGTLKTCTPPDTDSTSTDATEFTIVVAIEGYPTAV